MLELIKKIADLWELECKVRNLPEKTREGIGRFLRTILTKDDELESASYLMIRIQDITTNAETPDEFIRWTRESISEKAYQVARRWALGEGSDEILVFNDCESCLQESHEAEAYPLQCFGLDFCGSAEECLEWVLSRLGG